MKVVDIPVTMIARDALLVSGNEPGAHRGLWSYDPDAVGCEVEVGDVVVFVCLDEPIEVGVVDLLVSEADMPKFCSRINSKHFRWRGVAEIDDVPIERWLESQRAFPRI